MAEPIGTREWLDERQRERDAERQERSDEWFASNLDIPDIDFTVVCPICEATLESDDGHYCAVCRVLWPRNGYGHEAERMED